MTACIAAMFYFVIFHQFLPLYSPNNLKNQNFEKMKKKKLPGNIILLHLCTTSDDHMMYDSWDIEHDRRFIILGHFLPFYPTNNLKNKNHEKMKNTPRDFTHVYHKLKSYVACFLRYWVWKTIFCHLGPFLPFYPTNNPKNRNFEKMKIASGDIIILHMCTKSYDHKMHSSCAMQCDRQHFLSFWTSFYPFTP